MTDELPNLCPFKRSIEGLRGTVLLRRHDEHAERCRLAIRRREHPLWSSQRTEFRVEAAA
jgi:hypothetical protein